MPDNTVEITPEAKGLGRSPACVDYDGAPQGASEQRRLLNIVEAACLAEPPPPPDPDFSSAERVEQMPAAVRAAIYDLLHATGKWTDRHHATSARVVRAVVAAGQLTDVYPTDSAASNALDVGSSAFTTWKKALASVRGGHIVPPAIPPPPPTPPPPQPPPTPLPPPSPTLESPAASLHPSELADDWWSPEPEAHPTQTWQAPAAPPPSTGLPPVLPGDAFQGGDNAAPPASNEEENASSQGHSADPCQTHDEAEGGPSGASGYGQEAQDTCPICCEVFDPAAALDRRGEQAWGYTPCCSNPLHFQCLSTWLAGGPKRTRQHVASDGAIANTPQSCPMCRTSITRRALVQDERPAVQTVILEAIAIADTTDDAASNAGPPPAHETAVVSKRQQRAYTQLVNSICTGRNPSVVKTDATAVAYLMGSTDPNAATIRAVIQAVQQRIDTTKVFRHSIGAAAVRRKWHATLHPLHDSYVRSLPATSILATEDSGASSSDHAPFPPPPPAVPPAPPPHGGALGSTSLGSHNLNMNGNEPIAQEVRCDRSTAFGNCFVGYHHPQLSDIEREGVCDAFGEAARRLAGGEVLKPPTLKAIATKYRVTVARDTPINYGGALTRAMRPLIGTRPNFKCSRSCIGRRCHRSALTAWATKALSPDGGTNPFDLGEGVFDSTSRATVEFSAVRRRVSSSDAAVYTDVTGTTPGHTAPLPAIPLMEAWRADGHQQCDLPVGVTAHMVDHYAQRGIVGQAAADELNRIHESAKTVEGAETDGSTLQSCGRTLLYLAGRHVDGQTGHTGEAGIMAKRAERFSRAAALDPPRKGKVAWSGGKVVTNKFDAVAAFIKRKRKAGTMPKDLERRLNATLHPYGHVEHPMVDDGSDLPAQINTPAVTAALPQSSPAPITTLADDHVPETPMEAEPLDTAPSRADAGTPAPTRVRTCTAAAPVRVGHAHQHRTSPPPTRTREGPPRHAGWSRTSHAGTTHATPRPHKGRHAPHAQGCQRHPSHHPARVYA